MKKIKSRSKRTSKRRKTFIFFGIGILFFIAFFLYFNQILYPAYYNYKANCNLLDEKEQNQTIELGATTITGAYSYDVEKAENISSNVSYNKMFKEKNITIPDYLKKHENCHVQQIERLKRGDFFYPSCEVPITMYLWELECWHVHNLPDWIYIPLYGEYN